MKSVPHPAEGGSGRVLVATVYAEVVEVWFDCPCCGAPQGGYVFDPRGQRDVICGECDGHFDVPARAALKLV